jgi:hypothetical protein
MRRLLGILTVATAIAAAAPAAALAAPAPRLSSRAGALAAARYVAADHALVSEPGSVGLGVALPIYRVPSFTWRPPGFSTDAAQAVAAIKRNPKALALHARMHPLSVLPLVWLGRWWEIDFVFHGKLVMQVSVSKAGRVTGVWEGPLALAPYARGSFAVALGHGWLLAPLSLLFLLALFPRGWRPRLAHLDALVLLSFLVSYLLFDHAHLLAGVWTVYPPLLYLLGRLLWIGFARAKARRRQTAAPLLPLPVLAGGLLLLVVARAVLSLTDVTVSDVGYASVIGAHQIATGAPLYFHSAAHGDTYGPIAYLAYLPFELLFPWHGSWDYLPSAHAASLFFDLVTIAALVALGLRMRGGREGLRLGLALGWAWAACPFTLLALMMHTNDGLIAMLSVLSLLAFTAPAARGALLGLAAAAKFAPAVLLGLYAAPRRGGRRQALICAGAFAAVVAISIGLYLPQGGLGEFYRETIGFQLHRTDVFSPWALHPGLEPLKLALEVAAVGLALLVTLRPRRRTLAQVAALAGALTIAVQLPAVHWFYYYIVWFAPFALVALLAGEPGAAAVAEPEAPLAARDEAAVPVLA